MRGRTRYLIALCFAAMFVLVPSPDKEHGKPYLGYLQVREWLFDKDNSPLLAWQSAGQAPQLGLHHRLGAGRVGAKRLGVVA